ncbi:MAG TPA: hypothetical protein DD001_00585 [Microcoleaceae bacterium UBA10368]|nr:hypothetical protein [Microcoleaceae cyanobacterium UBA10368]
MTFGREGEGRGGEAGRFHSHQKRGFCRGSATPTKNETALGGEGDRGTGIKGFSQRKSADLRFEMGDWRFENYSYSNRQGEEGHARPSATLRINSVEVDISTTLNDQKYPNHLGDCYNLKSQIF